MKSAIASFDCVAQLGSFIKERFKNEDLKVSAFFINDTLAQVLGYNGHDHLIHHVSDQQRTILPKFNDDRVLDAFWDRLVAKVGVDVILDARKQYNEKPSMKAKLKAKSIMTSVLNKLSTDDSYSDEINDGTTTIELIKSGFLNSIRNQIELMSEVKINKDDVLSYLKSYKPGVFDINKMMILVQVVFDNAGNPEHFNSFRELSELFSPKTLKMIFSEEQSNSLEACLLFGLFSVHRDEFTSYLESERGYKLPFKVQHPNAFRDSLREDDLTDDERKKILFSIIEDVKNVRTIISNLPTN